MARQAEVRYVNFYNVGSTAYKLDTVSAPKKQAMPLPKQRKLKKTVLRVDPVAAFGMALSFVMVIMMVVGLFRLGTAQKESAQMQAYVQQLEAENKVLDAKYHAAYDPDEIRQVATQMGMVPIEQVQHIQISVPEIQPVQTPSAWDRVYTFLAGLFA